MMAAPLRQVLAKYNCAVGRRADERKRNPPTTAQCAESSSARPTGSCLWPAGWHRRLLPLCHKFFVGVSPGRVRSTRARNPYPRRRGYGFRARRFAAPRNDFSRSRVRADLDHIESHTGVVAGLVPATPSFYAGGKIIEVARTRPATTPV